VAANEATQEDCSTGPSLSTALPAHRLWLCTSLGCCACTGSVIAQEKQHTQAEMRSHSSTARLLRQSPPLARQLTLGGPVARLALHPTQFRLVSKSAVSHPPIKAAALTAPHRSPGWVLATTAFKYLHTHVDTHIRICSPARAHTHALVRARARVYTWTHNTHT